MGIGFKTRRMPCVYLLALLAFSAVVVGIFCRLRLGLEWQVGLIISANSLYLLFFAYSLVQYLRGRVTVKFIVTMVVSLSTATLLISRFCGIPLLDLKSFLLIKSYRRFIISLHI